jgi:hypothetical protein
MSYHLKWREYYLACCQEKKCTDWLNICVAKQYHLTVLCCANLPKDPYIELSFIIIINMLNFLPVQLHLDEF